MCTEIFYVKTFVILKAGRIQGPFGKMEEEAYIYCVKLSEKTVKIGSHLGSLKKLDARYGTYCTLDALKENIVFRIEPRLRACTLKEPFKALSPALIMVRCTLKKKSSAPKRRLHFCAPESTVRPDDAIDTAHKKACQNRSAS